MSTYAYFHHHYLLTIITRFTKWSCSQTCVIPWMASRSPGHMCLLASTRNPRTPMFIWWRWSGVWWWQWCSENLLGLPRRCNNLWSFLWHTWEEQVTVDNYEVDSIKPILVLRNNSCDENLLFPPVQVVEADQVAISNLQRYIWRNPQKNCASFIKKKKGEKKINWLILMKMWGI